MSVETIKEFTDLNAWQECHKLVLLTYTTTKSFPKDEQFALTNQMRRAAVSITSNIAEGFGRRGVRERIQFYYLAHGSLTELKSQIYIARDLGYATNEGVNKLFLQLSVAHALLQGLIRKTKERSHDS